jgi:hypothetical protein
VTSEKLAMVPKEKWAADKDHKVCMVCLRPFTVFNRRHHCRACGHVVCASCGRFEPFHPPFRPFSPATSICTRTPHTITHNHTVSCC